MGIINQLPASVINQIAAGEVVERPASVVKELLENSIDAGATRIDVTVERGGKDLIRIADNGAGIAPDDLPIAFQPHATSKLAVAEDLFRIQTLGFRGEALAAIAEVSRLRCQSRQADAAEGSEINIDAGVASPIVPTGCPLGTVIEVRNLFFNTPVRRAFLKSDSTEAGHVTDIFARIVLAHPTVHMTFRSGGRLIHDLPPVTGIRERIAVFFGRELADALLWIESKVDSTHLWGYVAHPSQNRSSNKAQFLFVGGRYVRDRSLAHALAEAYRGLIMVGRQPVAFLHLEIPPEEVDVNVHPSKIEVRFRDAQRIYSQLLSTVRQTFLASDLHAKLQAAEVFAANDPDLPVPVDQPAAPPPPAFALNEVEARKQEVASWFQPGKATESFKSFPSPGYAGGPTASPGDWANRLIPSAQFSQGAMFDEFTPATSSASNYGRLPAPSRDDEFRPTGSNPFRSTHESKQDPQGEAPAPRFPSPPYATSDSDFEAPAPRIDSTPAPSIFGKPSSVGPPPKALQVHDSYLIAETNEGMMVIDQHALHERILYEELRERIDKGSVEAQRLLVPETVNLSASESAAVLEQREMLRDLGIEIEEFGGDTVLVNTTPVLLRGIEPERLIRDLAEHLRTQPLPPTRDALLGDLLHMIACKAAVKAGQRLTPEEVAALLERRHLVSDSHHCPHGRPTALVFTKSELERQFGRI